MKDIKLGLYSLLPKKYTDMIEREARYARFRDYEALVFYVLAIYVVGALIGLAVFAPWDLAVRVGVYIALLPVGLIFPYAIISVMAERRKRTVETVLSDALLLMSANIESGMTVDRAFLMSAREEFGPLADDIRKTAMKMFSGVPADRALQELADQTNSELFAETLKLLIDGLNAGGQASRLLESSAEDIRKSLYLREEIAANVKMYSIFILMASLLGAPVLFAVSTYLAETSQELWSGQGDVLEDLPQTGPFTFSEPKYNVEFFRVFAVASLIISNVFASLIISEIKNGNIRGGFKLAPVYPVIAVTIFFVVEVVIKNTLGSSF